MVPVNKVLLEQFMFYVYTSSMAASATAELGHCVLHKA